MSSFNSALPPLLEMELVRALRRYRRLRVLRSSMKFFLVLLPSACAIGGLAYLWLPLPNALLASAIGGLALLSALWAFWPLLSNPLSLRDIATFIDHQHPDLQDRLLSAVALSEKGGEVPSAWMLEHFLADTQHRVKGVPLDDFMHPWELRCLAGGVALCIVLCIAGALGAAWKSGLIRSVTAMGGLHASASLEVKPGDAEVQPGDNQIVWVTSSDTESAKYIYWEQGGVEQRAILESSSTPEVSYHTFQSLQDSLRYQVRVGGAESARYEIRVNRPPAVESIHAHYEYPAYLGLEAESVPYSGELKGVEGTRVTLRVEVNKVLESIQLIREAADPLALEVAGENKWTCAIDLEHSDTYHLVLRDLDGNENPDPETYAIRVTPDNPPEIRVKFPRGDAKVLALEEVPFAFEVKDDYGMDGYGIEYTLAGRDPVRIALNQPGAIVQEAVADHLLALEDLGLAEGDLVTWSVWATDKKPDRAAYETSGDPYFLEVRPYTLRYREQISQGGAGTAGAPSLDEKKIIIALTNLRKTVKTMNEAPFTESLQKIEEGQTQIRDEVSSLLAQASEEDQQIAGEAVQAMDEVLRNLDGAVWPEPETALSDALKPAQEAWQLVLKLEPDLCNVAQQEGGGGGGGGAAQGELDALEMGQRKDYVEEASTGAEEAAQNEAMRSALDDLARRQELLNEDLGKLISEEEQARAAEEKKRQLERLQEEQKKQLERLDTLRNQMAESGMSAEQRESAQSTLDQARDAMERSLESVREEALQEARSSGNRAAQSLADAETTLDQLTRAGARERFEALEDSLNNIAERQAEIQEQTAALKDEQATPGLEGHDDWARRMESLKGEKRAMAESTTELLKGAGALSDQLRENQELLSRKLGDWARRTSRTGVVEDMEEGMPLVEYGVWDAAERQEAQVKAKLDEAAKSLESLRGFLPGASDDTMARALEMLAGLNNTDTDLSEAQGGKPDPSEAPRDESGAGQTGQNASSPSKASPNEGATDKAPAARSGAGAPGDSSQPGEPGPRARGEGSAPSESAGGLGAGGGDEGRFGGATSMDEFFNGEAREWRPVLRDAAALLPRESTIRQSLEQVEMELGRLQRGYDQSKTVPDAGEFEQVVRRPLMDTVSTLEALVRNKATGEASWLEDEGAIPEQYVDRVAEYFRLLAEQSAKP